MKKSIFIAITLLLSFTTFAESLIGNWKTIDDDSGEETSIIKIYEKGGKIYGDIIELLNEADDYDPICDQCPGAMKNQKVIGLTIINGLEKEGDIWAKKGGIIDPDNGKWYDVKIWREENKLMVRGYIGFFYRTQTWILAE